MNKIPLSVVALAAVSVSATAAEAVSKDEMKQALKAQRDAATTEISRVINEIDTYHGAVKEKYQALASEQQALLNAAYDKAIADVEAGTEGVVLDTAKYVDAVKTLGDEAKTLEAQYDAWDAMYTGEFKALKDLNTSVTDGLTKAALPYSYDAQKAAYDDLKVQELIGAVEADHKAEGGNIKKTEEYKGQIKSLTDALTTFKKQMGDTEKAAKDKALNKAAYEEVKTAIEAAKKKRNEIRDALVELLPSTTVYGDWQSAALAELTEQVTKVINDVEKSNEAANNDEKAATVKDDNLSKLSVVTGYDPVDPNPMSVATTIYGKYYDMKEVQEEAYAALTTAYDAKFALFAPVKETIKASTVTYLDTDKEELTNAFNTIKASIESAYKVHTVDQLTPSYNDIDVRLAALETAANKAKADYDAHDASVEKIAAKQTALDDAIKEAKKKTTVGDYVAYDHFTKTSDGLQKKITAEVNAEAAAWSTTDASKAGKAVEYAGKVVAKLAAIDIAAYTTNTEAAKTAYTAAKNTIDAADKALNSTTKNELGLKETAKEDLTVTIDGNVGSKTYGDAINHFTAQLNGLTSGLNTAVKTAEDATPKGHLALLQEAAAKSVADFQGKDMATLTSNYATNKTNFEANLKITAANKILGEVNARLTSAKTDLDAAIVATADYGVKATEISNEKADLDNDYTTLKGKYDALATWQTDGKDASEVIASLNALKEDLTTLQEAAADLKAKAESAAKNKTAYDAACGYITAAANAITAANSVIDNASKVLTDDYRGQTFFDNTTGVLSKLTTRKNNLQTAVDAAYTADKQTVADQLEVAETGFKALAEKIEAEANAATTNFTDNETFHKNHVDARDAELTLVQALYDKISSEDETTAANDYLADLAKLQEQLLNMTNPAAKGIITEKLAAGLSKQDNQEVLDAIKAIADKRIEIRDTQLDEYKQNVLDDNDAELGAFDAAYNKAYKAFQEAVKTLNDYAAISYNDDVKAIAQDGLIATHDKIYGQAAPLLDQKTKANADYNEKCNLETPKFFKSADYVAAVVAIENQINSDINAYVKNVNDKAAELANTYLTAAQTALTNAKTDATYTAFEYATRDKAFKYVEDLIALVEGKLAADPKFAVNLDKQNWLNDLKTVDAKIADLQEAAALAEYDYQLGETNKLVEAEKAAIKKLGNLTEEERNEWLDKFDTNELKKSVTAATAVKKQAEEKGWLYINIDYIKRLLAKFKASMTDDGNGKLHTATYYDAKQANDAAGENAEAVKKLDQKIPAAVKVVDELGDWLDALFVAHTDPAGASIAAYQTLADNVNGIEEGYTDEMKDGGAVGYLRRYQGILDAAANDAKDIKKAALGEELEAVKGLIENAEEKYNQYAKQDLEGASKFDVRMTTAGNTLADITTLYNKIAAETEETKQTYDDVKTQVLTLESDIAKLDGELAKKMNSKVIANAHDELTTSIKKVEGNIAAAKATAEKYTQINEVFGNALDELSADLKEIATKEVEKYEAKELLMYEANFYNDVNAVSAALDDLKTSTATEEGLDDMYARFQANDTYYDALKAELEGYKTELERVKTAIADYKYLDTDFWKTAYEDVINGMIQAETTKLNDLYEGIKAADQTTGVNAFTTIAQAQEIQDETAESEYSAAEGECWGLYNSLYNTVTGANRKFNNIVTGIEDGKRYNPATSAALSTTISELQSSRMNVRNYVNTLNSYGQNNPYGYVDVDLNGAPIALDPVTDQPIMVKRYFLEAWYNEIHAALNTLIAGAKEVAEDVEEKAFVLGDVNNNGVINVADYDRVRQMILSADMKKFEDAVALFGEVPAYAADVNEDQAIDVADLTSISNFIFNGGFDKDAVSKAARVKTAGKVMCDDVVTLQAVSEETTLTGKTMRLAVNVANTTDYVNFQMDVQLPEGMTLVGESLSERANGHLLSTADLGNGAFRMVAENVENVAFGNQTNAVLYLDVEVSSNYNAGEVALSNIIFSDAKGNAYRMNGLTTNAPTGINEITAPNMKERIYSVGGQVMKAMKKGVNIIKGEGSVKKVVKK